MSLVIFVEEPSMSSTLEPLLEKLGVDLSIVKILTHQGKSDLEISWRRKLPNYNTPGTRFLILRDVDGKDCRQLKEQLLRVAIDCGKQDVTKIRIVCQELEAWFLGDPNALLQAGYTLPQTSPRELREPDTHRKPSEILERWKPGRQKVSGAREIAIHMDVNKNNSASFNATICALRELS